MGIWLNALAIHMVSRLPEWRIHRRNVIFLRFADAEEWHSSSASLLYLLGVIVWPFAIAEYFLLPRVSEPFLFQIIGLNLLMLGTGLRVWSIHSLGNLWSIRSLYIPGLAKTKMGPYRFLDHPEYLGRGLEGLGLILVLPALWTAVGFAVLHLALLTVAAKQEEAHLSFLAPVQEKFNES